MSMVKFQWWCTLVDWKIECWWCFRSWSDKWYYSD
jgi:hypothetical protein